MIEALNTVGSLLPLVAVGLSLVGGLAAFRVITRPDFPARADRRAALAITIVIATPIGAAAAVLTAMLGSSWGGGDWVPALPLTAVVFGLPAAAIVAGSSLAGFAILGRLRIGINAAVGACIGPVVLGLLCLTAVEMVNASQTMLADARLEAERRQIAADSTGLHLEVDDLTTTVDAAGAIESVRMRLTIRSDEELAIAQLPGKLVYPIFVLSRGDDANSEIQTEAPLGSPSTLAAGSAAVYEITFDPSSSGSPEPATPGDWELEVRIGGADGVNYGLHQTVTLAAS